MNGERAQVKSGDVEPFEVVIVEIMKHVFVVENLGDC